MLENGKDKRKEYGKARIARKKRILSNKQK